MEATLNQSVEEQEFYFVLSLFDDDYYQLRDAIKVLTSCNLKPKILLGLIEEVRFHKSDLKIRNYDKIKPYIEELLDYPMDRIRVYRMNNSGNLFGYEEDNYLDEMLLREK